MERENGVSETDAKSDYEILRGFLSNQLAKYEMKELLHDRLALKARSRGKQSKKESTAASEISDLEHMYSLVECLPQRNRCTQPPREPFLTLANEAAASSDDPMTTLQKALLLEEYAIQLFAEHEAASQSQTCETASPWALACSGITHEKLSTSERDTLHSKRIASQLHSILERLSAGDMGSEQDGKETGQRENEVKPRRKRKRKRSRLMHTSNEDEQLAETESEKRPRKGAEVNAVRRRARKEAGEYSSSDNYRSEESEESGSDSSS